MPPGCTSPHWPQRAGALTTQLGISGFCRPAFKKLACPHRLVSLCTRSNPRRGHCKCSNAPLKHRQVDESRVQQCQLPTAATCRVHFIFVSFFGHICVDAHVTSRRKAHREEFFVLVTQNSCPIGTDSLQKGHLKLDISPLTLGANPTLSSSIAFVISGTVRVQYMSLPHSECAAWYAKMSARRDTVFPVPVGISRIASPLASSVAFNSRIY